MTHTEICFLQVSVFNQVSTFLLSAIRAIAKIWNSILCFYNGSLATVTTRGC